MLPTSSDLRRFIVSVHPYDALPFETLRKLQERFRPMEVDAGAPVYHLGEKLNWLYLIYSGQVEVRDENENPISLLGARNSFGERGLVLDGFAATSARAVKPSVLLLLPEADFKELMKTSSLARRFFDRRPVRRDTEVDLATSEVAAFMTPSPKTCTPESSILFAAQEMRAAQISSLCVMEQSDLVGIVTLRDLAGKALARALPLETPVAEIMSKNPVTLGPTAIGSDVLHAMMERKIGHVPICEDRQLVGIVSQTDLTRFQAESSAILVSEVAESMSAEDMAKATGRIPQLLLQLVGAGKRHEVVTRLITDIADTATRRLLSLAEDRLGPPPVPYLWAACGSQGRQEQTGVSDQDNCLILDDAVTEAQMEYFHKLARFVCDGLNTCGYEYCPGDMMAINPQWCQPMRVWREYFQGWINTPDPKAQMLASVMFDLRGIGGDQELLSNLQRETLEEASANSIFTAHMVANSLKHTPPLGLLRGFATIRSGVHKNTLDLKHNGVVPVVDLARIYALIGQFMPVNTRARLLKAQQTGGLSVSGARDLLDAYDLIAETRLEHQARQIRRNEAPNNYMEPSELSDLERSHLRNAFVVIKTLQSAVGHGRSAVG